MHKVFDIAMAVIVLAGIFTLARPRSQGPKLITSLTNGFAGVVKSATGGGKF